MLAGIRKLIKGALFDSKGSLSLSRCVLLFVVAEVTAITWLAVLWCHYVTVNGLMVEAAPLAQAVSTGAAAVLSSQVAAAAFQYFTQAKFSGGGVSYSDEPRVAAESSANVTEPTAALGDLTEPVDVNIVGDETEETKS